jgi:putative hydrolase of the HAD superfamily
VIELIAFDGDDTLWQSEQEFASVQQQVHDVLATHCDPSVLEARLLETERRNLELYGYGAKAFTLSVLETAVELAGDDLTITDVRAILSLGKELLRHPIELLAGAAAALEWASDRWPVVLVTKGDLFHQESKLARSGLGDRFHGIEIVAEKDPSTYARVCRRHGVAPEHLVMVGNSLRSDVGPVLELGGWAVHVPHALTWALEEVDDSDVLTSHPRYREIATLADLPAVLYSGFSGFSGSSGAPSC